MGKVYIGVTAVGGHKLWGVVGNRRIDGRRLEVAGRACPAPTGGGWGERVLARSGQSES